MSEGTSDPTSHPYAVGVHSARGRGQGVRTRLGPFRKYGCHHMDGVASARSALGIMHLMLVCSIAACSPTTLGSEVDSTVWGGGPFVVFDPGGLVESVRWVDSFEFALPVESPQPGDLEHPQLLDSGNPHLIWVAVAAGGCPPAVDLAVTASDDRLEVGLQISEPLMVSGLECADILQTLAFELVVGSHVSVGEVTLSAVDDRVWP